MRAAFRLDAIVTVVDTKHVLQHLDTSPEVKKQIAFADVLILNKTDLVSPAELDALETRIRRMNGAAKIHRAQNADVPLAAVLDVGGFQLSRATEIDPKFLQPSYPFEWAGVYPLKAGAHTLEIGHCDCGHDHGEHGHDHDHADHGHHHHHHHGEEHSLDVALIPVKSLDETDLATTRDAAVLVFSDWENRVQPGESFIPGATLQRLHLGEHDHAHYPFEVAEDGLYMVFEGCGEHPLHIYPAGSEDNVRPAWQADYEHTHSHDDDVTSVGITLEGDFDAKKLNAWIGELLQRKGNDIYRAKGVLSVKGSPNKLVFQGVHMLFDAKFDRPWGDQPRKSTLVFIGKDLDRAALNEGVQGCLA
ncbi:MAG: GTP-binding protein [Verrucomicrobiota bacterium]